MDLWVVGAGGLLGSAVTRNVAPGTVRHRGAAVPWGDPGAARQELRQQLLAFRAARRPGVRWGVAWAAGTGVPASGSAELDGQTALLRWFAEDAVSLLDPDGTFFFASSASVYGAEAGECDESTPPAPHGAYAAAKLRQEETLRTTFEDAHRSHLVVGRISTLYGPGQNLSKRQGLVSTMALEAVQGGVITLHVPFDTMRDFLYADDAARMCLRLLSDPAPDGRHSTTRVLASRRPTSIGELSRVVQAVAHRRTPVVQASVPAGARPQHMSLRSVDATLGDLARTPLVVGVKTVVDDVRARFLTGGPRQPV